MTGLSKISYRDVFHNKKRYDIWNGISHIRIQ